MKRRSFFALLVALFVISKPKPLVTYYSKAASEAWRTGKSFPPVHGRVNLAADPQLGMELMQKMREAMKHKFGTITGMDALLGS